MLVSAQELMQDAVQRNYCVAAFAAPAVEYVRGCIRAAEEMGNAPIMLMMGKLETETGTDFDFISEFMKDQIAKTRVPVAMHIDHAPGIDFAMAGIKRGFNSIMFDRACLPFEENVAETKAFCELAHRIGVAVEGEIGAMPSNVVGHGDCTEFGQSIVNIRDYFTKPEQVGEFVDRTGVDMLTVSFGTVHGILVDAVDLDIDLLKQIDGQTDCPLVMHGSSGTPDDQIAAAVNNGINKINFYTGYSEPVKQYMVEYITADYGKQTPPYFHNVLAMAEKKIVEIAKNRIQLFSNGVKF